MFELVRELVGGLFGWVWEFMEELIDEIGITALIFGFLILAPCCYGYWAAGNYWGADEDWGQYFTVMCLVGLVGSTAALLAFGIVVLFDDESFFEAMVWVLLIPLILFGSGFLVFGVITIVIRLAG